MQSGWKYGRRDLPGCSTRSDEMDARPRSPVRVILYAVLILAGILVYAYGWQVTDINLEEPQEADRQKQVMRALRGLLNPDLIERDRESHIAYTQFRVPCSDGQVSAPEAPEGQPYLTLSPVCGATRDQITIEGYNFRPYSDGFVRWTPPGGSARSLGRIRTDGDGHFKNQLRVPSVSESGEAHTVEAEIVWSVGVPRASEALKITVERMVETIFLALMATTFAIVIAIPISFIAAHNLMRQVQMPLGSLLAALLPLPLGWLAGQRVFRPASDLALGLGASGWLGFLALVVVAAVLYVLFSRKVLRVAHPENRWWLGVVTYVRMTIVAGLVLSALGVVSGVGIQVSVALNTVLGGILGNVVGTVAELLGLLLPTFGGLAGMLILGSLVSTLFQALLNRLDIPAVPRVLGLVLGVLAGGLVAYLAYRGIYNFYNPGEPPPLAMSVAIGGVVVGGACGLALGADYLLPVGLIVYYITRTILNAMRSVEPLIMAIVFAIWVSIGPFAGVLALTLHSIAALGKLYSEQVESIDPGPIEAITATGATRLQTIVYGVVPQIVPPYIAFTLYRWDINVRMSTIIGFVGGGSIYCSIVRLASLR
jgi:ABC-type phosphate/phosphonate transport system permease subunit